MFKTRSPEPVLNQSHAAWEGWNSDSGLDSESNCNLGIRLFSWQTDHLREAEKHLSNVGDAGERQSYKSFAGKLSVAICFPYPPQNRVCMCSLLICWIAASVSSRNRKSLTSPWVLAKTLYQHGNNTSNQHRKRAWPLRVTSPAAKDKSSKTSVFNI